MPEYTIEVVTDTLRLLEAVGENPGTRLPELAQRSQLTKTKTFRILRTLETSGYIVQDSSQMFYLHQKAYLIGQQAKTQWSLARVTKPFLDELAEATQENIHLVIRDELSSVVVALRESSHPIRMYAEIGKRGPLHAGGTPKVLLAYAPKEILEQVLNSPLTAFTDETLVSKENLNITLETIRQNGFHVAKRDLDADAFSVAAPIIGAKKTIIAAISIAGPMMRLNPQLEQRYVALICNAAMRISHQLSNGINDT
jgi:IclR family transcriptional regulator, KDG regulon repressor